MKATPVTALALAAVLAACAQTDPEAACRAADPASFTARPGTGLQPSSSDSSNAVPLTDLGPQLQLAADPHGRRLAVSLQAGEPRRLVVLTRSLDNGELHLATPPLPVGTGTFSDLAIDGQGRLVLLARREDPPTWWLAAGTVDRLSSAWQTLALPATAPIATYGAVAATADGLAAAVVVGTEPAVLRVYALRVTDLAVRTATDVARWPAAAATNVAAAAPRLVAGNDAEAIWLTAYDPTAAALRIWQGAASAWTPVAAVPIDPPADRGYGRWFDAATDPTGKALWLAAIDGADGRPRLLRIAPTGEVAEFPPTSASAALALSLAFDDFALPAIFLFEARSLNLSVLTPDGCNRWQRHAIDVLGTTGAFPAARPVLGGSQLAVAYQRLDDRRLMLRTVIVPMSRSRPRHVLRSVDPARMTPERERPCP